MESTKIAVLITCHNRQQKTLASLAALFNQALPEEVTLCVYLVDDGSTDGTELAVRQAYPQVKILQGDGSLFWNGGMRLAFAEAIKYNYDYYLWLNDDTILYPKALGSLLTTSHSLAKQGYSQAIVVGSTQDPESGVLTYGGIVRYSWWYPLKFRWVEPGEEIKSCDTMHGNCVLIPQEVAKMVGNLDAAFIHNLGDFDYGFRAISKGCSVWLAPGYVGTCAFNAPSWREPSLPLRERLKKMNQPKGLLLMEWKVYAQRHAGPLWPIYWLLPYVKLLMTSAFGKPS